MASKKLTTETGAPVGNKLASMTVGPRGPVVIEDTVLIEETAHFDRERIPERVVHAKGAGAFGYFETTHDITKYTKLAPFASVGKRTPLAARFSTVGGESGSADTARDPRGFAIKFYTEEGNWDLVGNNTPIFFIRDPILFPSFIHTQKRNPSTHLKDPDMFWDFISLRPETTHQVCFLFGDRGTPDGYRFMNGYGSHTYVLTNDKDEIYYVKFHFKCDQGIKNLLPADAGRLAGDDPDYAIRDLFKSIQQGNNPSWTLKLQIMTQQQIDKANLNPFDVTKIWPQDEYPLIPVGKMVLDRNPENYFAEVEQIAFCPSHMIPGVQASPDKMLQGRLFSYSDTHRHRLGANYLQIPVNCPYRTQRANYYRDGPACVTDNQKGAPNYYPNSFGGPEHDVKFQQKALPVSGVMDRYNTHDDDNFSQVTTFWTKVLDEAARARLVDNIAGHLKDAQEFIQQRAVSNFAQVHADFGSRLTAALKKYNQAKKASKM